MWLHRGIDPEGCVELANAIVILAANDYRKHRTFLKRAEKVDPAFQDEAFMARMRMHRDGLREIEQFFRSKWYSVLTQVDGEMLLKKLKEESDESERISGNDSEAG